MIGEHLKISREEANKSVYQVAEELKINNSQVYRWKNKEFEKI